MCCYCSLFYTIKHTCENTHFSVESLWMMSFKKKFKVMLLMHDDNYLLLIADTSLITSDFTYLYSEDRHP